jgi:hypothetical protein
MVWVIFHWFQLFYFLTRIIPDKVPMYEIFVNLTCLFRIQKLAPRRVWFRQVENSWYELNNWKKSSLLYLMFGLFRVLFRQVFGLFRVMFRQVSLYTHILPPDTDVLSVNWNKKKCTDNIVLTDGGQQINIIIKHKIFTII